MDDKYAILSLLPGLEAVKMLIEEKITEIKTGVGADPRLLGVMSIPQPVKKTRQISEEVKEQRRHTLANARSLKLARLYAAKAGLTVSEPTTAAGSKEENQQGETKNKEGTPDRRRKGAA